MASAVASQSIPVPGIAGIESERLLELPPVKPVPLPIRGITGSLTPSEALPVPASSTSRWAAITSAAGARSGFHALANVACKAAIKSGQALSPEEKRELIR